MGRIIKYLVIINLIFTMYSYGQIYKVDDFGAVGDGVTNDRDSIQAALDYVKEHGGELQFTSGKTYLLALSPNDDGLERCGLNIYRHTNTTKITTTGTEKATLKVDNNVPVIWGNWIFRLYDSPNITISNLCFDGNRDNRQPTETSGNYLLQIERRCDGLRLENLYVKNGVVDNVYIEGHPDDDVNTFMRDFEMHNCVLENAYRNNMSVIRGLNFKIIGCEFINANGTAPEAGIDFEPNSGGADIGYVNMLVEGCTFKDNKRYGIYLTDIESESGYSRIKNNIFDNCGLLIASEYNVAKNNIFINLDHWPIIGGNDEERDGIISFHVDFASNYNKVYNNYFYNNPTPSDMHLIAFMSGSGSYNEIYNNYSYNSNVAGFVTPDDRQVIYGNIFLNNIEMGFWTFDAGFITDSTASDLSDFGQTGILHGEPVVVGGKFNEALDFSPSNKYIEIPINKEHLNIEMNITISAWVKWKGSNGGSDQVIVGRGDDWQFVIDNDGKAGFYAPKLNDSSYIAGWTKSESTIPANEWTMVTMTYNGIDTKIYINGVEDVSEMGYGRLDTSLTKIYIASLNGIEGYFNGSIDDVRLYNYPLSQEEIDDLYNAKNVNDKAVPKGSGTKEDPYQIATVQNLSWLVQSKDKWDAYYIQTADIDLSVTATWDDSDDNNDGDKYNDANDRLPYGNNEGWYPIGDLNGTEKFSGYYDGNDYVISNLSITNRSTSGNGFFGEITGGTVKNLGLSDVNIKGSDTVGGLAAKCSGDSILRSFTTGTVTCTDGGAVGNNFAGFVGTVGDASVISECYSDVNVKGSGTNSEKVGGFAGSLNGSAAITESYSLGDIDSTGSTSGGFAGEVSGSSIVEHCYSVGLVDNGAADKGFLGSISDGSTPALTSNFFNTETSGHSSSAGAEGKTTDEMILSETFMSAGWDFSNVWETNTNYPNLKKNTNPRLEKGIDYKPIPAPSGSGTEDDPYQISSLSDLSWLTQVDSVWTGYFVQTANIDAAETATWDDSDDNNDGDRYNDPNDLTDEGTNDGFLPIGVSGVSGVSFGGYYDGDNYEIENLKINRPNTLYVGLFGITEKPHETATEIKNVNLRNIDIIGKGYVGGLTGKSIGVIITNCLIEGKVSSNSTTGYIGGFVGSNNLTDGTISKSSSDVDVTSSGSGKYVGGFVGRNKGGAVISRCCSKGRVETGGDKAGGFIGQNATSEVNNSYSLSPVYSSGTGTNIGGFCGAVYSATITNCYSVGVNNADNTKGFLGSQGGIGNVFTANYLDTLASGCNQSAVPEAASGKSTTEMQQESTYEGWDFTNIWSIDGSSYPMLNGVKVSVKENKRFEIPAEYVLEQNYPNPFNPTTTIRFAIPKQAHVKLSVYNIIGEEVAVLVNGNISSGYHEVNFNASNLSSGMYVYRIFVTSAGSETGSYAAVKKMLLLK